MYGWLLESIQHFVVQEFGEELWTLILQEAGSKNFVFNARQQYPDALMLRLSHALANRVANENASAATCSFKKSSLKSKPSWRSASVHADARTSFKCPFTSANALTAVTKKEIDAYNSLEEIRARTLSNDNFPTVSFNSGDKCKANVNKTEAAKVNQDLREDNDENKEQYKEDEINNEVFNNDMSGMVKTFRKTSITLALDVYRRKPSYTPVKHRIIKMKPPLPTIQFGQKTILKDQFDTPDKVMHFFGRCFVKFFTNYGYDTMIRATGRYFCTFLQSVDSIHQRMRFTFPRMRSPSMQLTRAHQHGAELVYSSGRTGFTHYLMGQLYEIAEDIFNLKLRVSIVKESMEGSYYVAVLRLEFDNTNYVQSLMLRKTLPCPLAPVPASLLLQLFPFGVMLDRKMQVVMAGEKLIETWGGPSNRINKSPVSDILRLRKPKISFTWDKVICMQNMMFELELMRLRCEFRRGSQGCKAILLRGPIHLLEEIDALMFLCSPIFNNLEELSLADLCLADLNGHGLSKEMLLEGWQHVSRLEMLFDKAENRSLSLEKSCRLLDQWKKRGDHLLYSMIPKGVADHLRDGKDPLAACQAFDCVTVMFCGMQLQEAGTRADVLQTVAEINDVYSKIDRLLDSHKVYKVETVGTVYMVVSGAPERRRAHAASAASAALAVIRALPRLTIGVHSGPCVAGVLGRRLPRYCLVGDTVNTASRMQTTSEPGKIQISTEAAERLPAGRFRLRRRGAIKVKGKGMMETFWLEGEIEEDEQGEALHLFSTLCGD